MPRRFILPPAAVRKRCRRVYYPAWPSLWGAALGYLVLQPFLSPVVFGSVFGVIAGVMVFLALDELLPAAKRYSDGHETVYGLTTGMAVIAVSLVLFHF